MSIVKNSVFLLKSDVSQEDQYKILLEANHFKVMIIKTLTFQYKNIDILKEKLLNPEEYSGIIFSSPRCVNAVSQALSKEKLVEFWGRKNNYSVGEATFDVARDKLGLVSTGKESGNAKNLAQVILHNENDANKPLLFPHGNLKTDTLKLELGAHKIAEILVYDNLPNPEIRNEIVECTKNFTELPEYLVYFSPSGLNSSLEYFRQIPNFSSVKLVAIGPVTELAIVEKQLKVHSVAQSPTPNEVLKAIL